MANQLPPVRALTRGPLYHWFGYYDKLETDPTGRYVLGMEVHFQHRSPEPDDVIRIGMVDTHDDDRWIELGETRAWCWQQGCMLQWRPGSASQIVWNDRLDDRFVCHLRDVFSGEQRTLPAAIYALSPSGDIAVGAEFRRIDHMRPGYGYAGLLDPHHDVAAPDDSGIYRIDLETGQVETILTIAEVAALAHPREDLSPSRHYFNHLLFNTDGTRFVFLHRWYRPSGGSFQTRMISATPNGDDLHVVDDYNGMSHFIWRDAEHILGWANRPSDGSCFHLYRDRSDEVMPIGKGVMVHNGHCTYLPGSEWILNDTYPLGENREQEVYLYHVATGETVTLGRFRTGPEYQGEWRCDTHPRYSPDGRSVVIDSTHGGEGRQLYRIDISEIVAG